MVWPQKPGALRSPRIVKPGQGQSVPGWTSPCSANTLGFSFGIQRV